MTACADLHARASLTPDAPALETERGVLSHAQLADRAVRAARWLADTEDAGPVGLLLDGSDFATWFHACLLTGRTVLPLNDRLTAGELALQLADARAARLLGRADDPRLAPLAERVPSLRAAAAPAPDSLPSLPGRATRSRRDPDAPAVVLFTSGTSGRARGACLSWRNFEASALAARQRLGEAVCGRWLACLPLFHVGGLSMLVRGVLFGGPVRLQPRFDPAALATVLDSGAVTGVSLVPTMLSRLLAQRGARPAPPGLRVLLLGGAAAAPELLRRALAAGYPVCPTYGLTEACSQVATAAPPAPGALRPGPLRPIDGTELRIVSAAGEPLPPGAEGEILVRGPTVMQGYLHDPASTAQALRDGWLHTGDLGRLDAEGTLEVLDRREDLVVSGGENVYPAEVEAALLEHPAILEAGVAGHPDADLGARVVAWIVVAPGDAPTTDDLRAHCRARLAGFKCPREFRVVPALPRNASGKLLRRRLPGL